MDLESIYLRPISYADTENIVRWRNQPVIKSKFVFQDDITEESHNEYMKNKVETGEVIQYIIVLKENDKDIGTVFVKDVDPERGCGEIGIFIGETEYQNKGLGSIATQILYNYLWDELGFNYVYNRQRKDNANSIRVCQNRGYQPLPDPEAYGIPDPHNPDLVYMILRNPNKK